MKHKPKNGKKTLHHLLNKCNGGKTTPWNLLCLREARHEAWHTLFHNMDLDEIIECLQRVKQLVTKKD